MDGATRWRHLRLNPSPLRSPLARLLLLPLLTPLLLAVAVGVLNPGPRLSLRLLTWRSPELPLGGWIGGAALGGALLSGGASTLALRQGQRRVRRQVRRPVPREGPSVESPWGRSDGAAPSRAPAGDREPAAPPVAGPSRQPGEPLPTVTVPFRVIRRGGHPEAASEPVGEPGHRDPVGVESRPVSDDWLTQDSDDW